MIGERLARQLASNVAVKTAPVLLGMTTTATNHRAEGIRWDDTSRMEN